MQSQCSWYFNSSFHNWQKGLNFDITITGNKFSQLIIYTKIFHYSIKYLKNKALLSSFHLNGLLCIYRPSQCTSSPLSLLEMVTKIPKIYLGSQHLPSERTLASLFFISFFTQRGGGERVRPSALPPPPCVVPVFDLNIYFREQTLVLMMKMIALLPSTVIKKHFTFKVCLLIVVRLCMIWTVEWCEIIVKLEHQKYFLNVIVVQEKSQSGLR